MRVPSLCLVTDRRALSPHARTLAAEIAALERQIDEAIDGGISLVQIRERDCPARVLVDFTTRIVTWARPAGTGVVVNDRLDVALAADGAGVHLRSDGPSVEAVRGLASSRLVGCSAHNPIDRDRVRGADYLVFGTVFKSASKADDAPVAGVETLRRACAGTSIPVLAIGGITPERAPACRDAGAAGVAAIRLFIPDVRRAIAAINDAWMQETPPIN